MLKRVLLLTVTAALLAFPSFLRAETDDGEQIVRILISENLRTIKFTPMLPIIIKEKSSGKKYKLNVNIYYEISPGKNETIRINRFKLKSPVLLLSDQESDPVEMNGRKYSENIKIMLNANGYMDMVELVPIEKYLSGVLPIEMNAAWPMEALKAQAVASRTYALKNLKPGQNYDMSDGTKNQAYVGSSVTNERILEAIDETKGQVMYYQGELIEAFFHALSGGHTAEPSAVWRGGADSKPLSGVDDPYCDIPKAYWEITISREKILSFLSRNGMKASKLKKVEIATASRSSGRVKTIKFITDKGSKTVFAPDFRAYFNSVKFKSTYIVKIVEVKNGWLFKGKGYGHGVGMCQEGAKVMAQKGKDYKSILKHYYPGISIGEYKR